MLYSNDTKRPGRDKTKRRYDVFISHSTRLDLKHRERVDALSHALKNLGLKVFLDRTERLEGQAITQVLRSAIETSAIGLLVLTRRALASAWVDDETNRMLCQQLCGKMRVMALRLEKGCQAPAWIKPEDVLEMFSLESLPSIAGRIMEAAREFLSTDSPG